MRSTDFTRPKRSIRTSVLAMVVSGLSYVWPALGQELAFPGADGYGAIASGWRGGDVVRVTNLAGDGLGTLRECAENGGTPRVCVFAVSGTIIVDRPIRVGSNLYIAGQTAPGDGIQLRLEGPRHGIMVLEDSHDVILRFIKLRPGPSFEPSPTVDALTVEDSERLYFGNLSMAFATDETFNIHVSGGRSADITLADSLLAFSLDKANHPDGRHSKGALICSTEGAKFECGRISLLRNLFAHHRDRNPDIKATSIGPVEVINNVFYNPISQFGEIYDLAGDVSLIYAENIVMPGPSTIKNVPEVLQVFDWTEASIKIAAWGNITPSRDGCANGRSALLLDPAAETAITATSADTTATVIPAPEAYAHVMVSAGDTIPGLRARDSLDQRVIDNVFACTGKVIDTVDQVGGWPLLAEAALIADSDGDGLPDIWEDERTGVDPNIPDNVWAMDSATGLSRVETWLATLAGDIPNSAVAAR